MRWFRIPKETTQKPSTGKYYSDWKEALSIEGKQQCVYCTIGIKPFGGLRNFHVEHYRPKAKDKFPELENEFTNLFFACSICNGFKSDDWNEPSQSLDNNSYPDPSKTDYSCFLSVDAEQLVESNFMTGRYIIQKLFLNRPQLILERKSFKLHEILKRETEILKAIALELKESDKDNPLIDTIVSTTEAMILLIEEKYINPYTGDQITR
jgi:hypothetical protein